jgi:hypothetical protein
MTTDILIASLQPTGRNFIAEWLRREPRFAGATLCLLALMLVTLFAMALDQRTLLGINVWIKPLKFEVALTVYLATLAWFAGWLPRRVADARWYRVFSSVVIACITAEMIWVCGAAAFGVASHFNASSTFMVAVYGLMGILAVLLTSATLVYGIAILRDRNGPLQPTFKLSVGIGLIATFVLTVIVAGAMSSTGSHFVGGNGSDVEAWPLMGWARDGGDLRVAHFFATHAMHVLPIVGFVAGSLLQARPGGMLVLGCSGLYATFVGLTFIEALLGRPFMTLLF